MLFNLSKISLLRSSLMGVGTLLIIICHAYGNNVKMPGILSKIVNNGQIGVDIFLLLSGIGIACSLSNINIFDSGKSLKEWYIKRVLRIYKPFTILSVCYYIYKFFFEDMSLYESLLHFSNLSWWINGRGAWYVSLIILLYLLSPLLYIMLYNARFKWLYLAIISFALMILCQDDNYTWFWYGSNALKRSPSFLIRMAIAKYVQEGKEINFGLLTVVSMIVFGLSSFLFPNSFCKWIVVLPFVIVLVYLIENLSNIQFPLNFLGMISLESYLTNIYIGDILNHKKWIICGWDLSYGHYLEYSFVIILGLIIAYYANIVSKKILIQIGNTKY